MRCVSLFPENEFRVAIIPRLEKFADFGDLGPVVEESTVYANW